VAVGAVLATVGAGALPVSAQTVLPAPSTTQPSTSQSSTGTMPTFRAWNPGSGATGQNQLLGRVEQPRGKNAQIYDNGTVAVSGWVVDIPALSSGWGGIDQMTVTSGGPQGQGTVLATGIVGETRNDVRDLLGQPYAAASGFTASFNANLLQDGQVQLWINVHTPGHGWYYKSLTVTINPAAATTYQNGDQGGVNGVIVVISRPLNGEIITTGGNHKLNNVTDENSSGSGSPISISGYSADLNLRSYQDEQGNQLQPFTGNQNAGLCASGIASINVTVDGQPVPYFEGPCKGNPKPTPLQHQKILTCGNECGQYGQQFAGGGWKAAFDFATLSPGQHNVCAAVVSSLDPSHTASTCTTYTVKSPTP
jgi:hypothetical protein